MKRNGKLIKTKERVKKYGEIFTPAWVVKLMVDALESNGNIITPKSTVLEPACGEGAFLIEILTRKFKRAKQVKNVPQMMITCIATTYGVDIQDDNVHICREKLYKQWLSAYSEYQKPNKITCDKVRNILKKNIVCGNFLTKIDKNGEPIVFLND